MKAAGRVANEGALEDVAHRDTLLWAYRACQMRGEEVSDWAAFRALDARFMAVVGVNVSRVFSARHRSVGNVVIRVRQDPRGLALLVRSAVDTGKWSWHEFGRFAHCVFPELAGFCLYREDVLWTEAFLREAFKGKLALAGELLAAFFGVVGPGFYDCLCGLLAGVDPKGAHPVVCERVLACVEVARSLLPAVVRPVVQQFCESFPREFAGVVADKLFNAAFLDWIGHIPRRREWQRFFYALTKPEALAHAAALPFVLLKGFLRPSFSGTSLLGRLLVGVEGLLMLAGLFGVPQPSSTSGAVGDVVWIEIPRSPLVPADGDFFLSELGDRRISQRVGAILVAQRLALPRRLFREEFERRALEAASRHIKQEMARGFQSVRDVSQRIANLHRGIGDVLRFACVCEALNEIRARNTPRMEGLLDIVVAGEWKELRETSRFGAATSRVIGGALALGLEGKRLGDRLRSLIGLWRGLEVLFGREESTDSGVVFALLLPLEMGRCLAADVVLLHHIVFGVSECTSPTADPEYAIWSRFTSGFWRLVGQLAGRVIMELADPAGVDRLFVLDSMSGNGRLCIGRGEVLPVVPVLRRRGTEQQRWGSRPQTPHDRGNPRPGKTGDWRVRSRSP